MRTIDIMGSKIAEKNMDLSDYILTIETDKTGLLDTKNIDSCFQSGYDTTIRNINKIKSILE